MFKEQEYKVLYKRIIFTCFILVIYILGSHISSLVLILFIVAMIAF